MDTDIRINTETSIKQREIYIYNYMDFTACIQGVISLFSRRLVMQSAALLLHHLFLHHPSSQPLFLALLHFVSVSLPLCIYVC